MRITAAQAIIECLAAAGVGRVYGVASGKMMPLLRAISERNALRFVGTRHECAAAMMAAADWLGTGQIAVAFGELGPGSTNLLAGVAGACNNNIPMIAISTTNSLHLSQPTRGMLMEADLSALFRPVTKAAHQILDGRRAAEVTLRALREAVSGRPGPVHIAIPTDVLNGTFSYRPEAFEPSARGAIVPAHPATAAVERAAELLATARRPLVLSGGGVAASGASAALMAVATRLGAPATTSQMGLGTVPTDSALCIGQGGLIGGPAIRRALAEADVVLAVGCRFSSWFWGRGAPAVGPARLIQIDVDPDMLGRIVPAELPIQADAAAALSALDAALAGRTAQADPAWLAGLRAEYLGYLDELGRLGRSAMPEGEIHPAALARALDDALPEDAIVTMDGGHTTFWHNDLLSARGPRTRLHEPGMAHLGFGLPWAIALKLAHPGRPVVCTTGDGAFGFTLQELDTARRYGLPVIVVIHNNAAWGIIRAGQHKAGFELESALEGTDYAAIARGFGCNGEVVTRIEDFAPAFQAALESDRPTVLDCRTGFVPHPGMAYFGESAAFVEDDAALPY